MALRTQTSARQLRRRACQLQAEVRWLEELHRAYEKAVSAQAGQPGPELLRILDRVHEARSTPALRMAAFLTPREREVLGALVRGQDTTRLARELGIAGATARCHIQSVLTKLGAHSRLEAATTAVRFGMVNPQTGRWLLPVDDR
jgi:DNA-binding NarL/FixJ family response regulator